MSRILSRLCLPLLVLSFLGGAPALAGALDGISGGEASSGLKEALGHGEGVEADVAELMLEAVEKFGDIDHLPYSAIMRAVVHYEPRKRRDK